MADISCNTGFKIGITKYIVIKKDDNFMLLDEMYNAKSLEIIEFATKKDLIDWFHPKT